MTATRRQHSISRVTTGFATALLAVTLFATSLAPAAAQDLTAPTKLYPTESATTSQETDAATGPDGQPLPAPKPAAPAEAGPRKARAPADRVTLYPVAANTPKGVLRLSTEWASHGFAFSVPQPAQAVRATLVTRFQNAADVLPARSRLVLSVNGEAVARLRPAAITGQAEVAVDVPVSLLRATGNTLTISTRHAHRVSCTQDSVYDLWTEIDAAATRLDIRYREVAPPIRPGNLNVWLGSGVFGARPVTMLIPGALDGEALLSQAAYVAQGLGARLPATQREVVVAPTRGAAGDDVPAEAFAGLDIPAMRRGLYVLLGTREELRPLLGGDLAAEIVGPHVSVHRLGGDPGKVAFVVSGVSRTDVLDVARRFAGMDDRRGSARLEPVPPFVPRRPLLAAERTYTLADLGYRSRRFGGLLYRETVSWSLPADLFPRHQQEAIISLNYAYGADLGPDAELVIHLNGETVAAFDLDDADGEIVDGRQLRLPLTRFRPGRNELTFEAKLPAPEGTDCLALATDEDGDGSGVGDGERQRFALFEDSSITFSAFSRLYTLPELHLLSSDGYPYTASQDEPVDLYVASPHPGPISAALTLAAQLRARGGPGFDIVGFHRFPALSSRDMLIVGSAPRLDSEVFDPAPVSRQQLIGTLVEPVAPRPSDAIGGPGAAPPQATAPATTGLAAGEAEDVRDWLESRRARDAATDPRTTPESDIGPVRRGLRRLTEMAAQAGDDGGRMRVPFDPTGLVMQYQSPQAPGETWTVVSAASPAALGAAARDLARPDLWRDLSGQALFFQSAGARTHAAAPDDRYYITSGDVDVATLMLVAGNWFSEGVIVLIALVIVTCLLFGALTYNMLSRAGRDTDEI